MADMITAVLNVVVGVTLITSVVMVTLKGVNTTSWSTAEISIFGVTGIITVVGVIYLIKTNLMG